MKNKIVLLPLIAIGTAAYACVQTIFPTCGSMSLSDSYGNSCTASSSQIQTLAKGGYSNGYNGAMLLPDLICNYSCTTTGLGGGTVTLYGSSDKVQSEADPNSGWCGPS